MNNSKRIVLILGNGFDLDLGLRTSYKDFWNSPYCPKNYPAPLISHLNSKWCNSLEAVKWYDLENELLNYYTENASRAHWADVLSEEEMDFIRKFDSYRHTCRQYDDKIDLINGLIQKGFIKETNPYLHTLEIPYKNDYNLSIRDRDYNAFLMIKQGLCDYLKSVAEQDGNKHSVALSVIYTVSEAAESGNTVSIYNFNYTTLPYPYCDFENLFYIHGRCKDENIIVGTKDYKEFSADYDFFQKSFDPNFQTPPVVSDLLHADEVVFFGHSLGMNDSQYLRPFFAQQTNIEHLVKKNITIFTRNAKSTLEIKRSLQQLTDYSFSLLNSLNHFRIIETEGINTNYKEYKAFLHRFLDDDNKVKAQLRNL